MFTIDHVYVLKRKMTEYIDPIIMYDIVKKT